MADRLVGLIRGINVGRAKRVAMADLREVVDDPSRLLVAVLADPADRSRLEPLARQDWDSRQEESSGPWCPLDP